MDTQTREFRAEAKFQRVSPQKARLVLDLIKGRGVEEALHTVAFAKKAVAPLVEKVLRSAVQNANHLSQEQGLDVDLDNLFVKRAVANEGPRMKRIRPAPMGRAYRYQRRLSHIQIALAERAQTDHLVHRVDDAPAAGEMVKPASKKTAGRKAPAGKAAKKAAKKAAAHKPAKKAAAKKSAKKK
jgi:large subunit ribosomal protein L22